MPEHQTSATSHQAPVADNLFRFANLIMFELSPRAASQVGHG